MRGWPARRTGPWIQSTTPPIYRCRSGPTCGPFGCPRSFSGPEMGVADEKRGVGRADPAHEGGSVPLDRAVGRLDRELGRNSAGQRDRSRGALERSFGAKSAPVSRSVPDGRQGRSDAPRSRKLGGRGRGAGESMPGVGPAADARGWVDPRDLLPPAGRAAVREEAGFRALFAELNRCGPSRVPSRSAAARLAALSVGSFKREILEVAGRSWRSFVRAWRVACAERMLDVRRPNEKAVARLCGYRSTSSLSRAFRAEHGVPPREFLRRRRRVRLRETGRLRREDSDE